MTWARAINESKMCQIQSSHVPMAVDLRYVEPHMNFGPVKPTFGPLRVLAIG